MSINNENIERKNNLKLTINLFVKSLNTKIQKGEVPRPNKTNNNEVSIGQDPFESDSFIDLENNLVEIIESTSDVDILDNLFNKICGIKATHQNEFEGIIKIVTAINTRKTEIFNELKGKNQELKYQQKISNRKATGILNGIKEEQNDGTDY